MYRASVVELQRTVRRGLGTAMDVAQESPFKGLGGMTDVPIMVLVTERKIVNKTEVHDE
jgi:hypothetical protein